MDFTKMSTPELTVFQTTLYSYMQEISQVIRSLNIIANHKDVIFDSDRRRNSLIEKSKEAEKIYERIQTEIEKRISKKLGMKLFDYKEIREVMEEAEEMLIKIKM